MARPNKIADPASLRCWACERLIEGREPAYFGDLGRVKCGRCGSFTADELIQVRIQAEPEVERYRQMLRSKILHRIAAS